MIDLLKLIITQMYSLNLLKSKISSPDIFRKKCLLWFCLCKNVSFCNFTTKCHQVLNIHVKRIHTDYFEEKYAQNFDQTYEFLKTSVCDT